MPHKPLSQQEEEIARAIVDAAYQVHKALGPGLLESVYEICFCYELERQGYKLQRQLSVPIFYNGIKLESGLRLDVLVENTVICELKAAEDKKSLFEAQLLSYLKLAGKRLGFLINFNVPTIKQGIKRMIL